MRMIVAEIFGRVLHPTGREQRRCDVSSTGSDILSCGDGGCHAWLACIDRIIYRQARHLNILISCEVKLAAPATAALPACPVHFATPPPRRRGRRPSRKTMAPATDRRPGA